MRTTLRLVLALAASTVSAFCSETLTPEQALARLQKQEANKKLVVDFYQRVFGDKDLTAIDECLTEGYIQHNPMAADGRAALKAILEKWLAGAPKSKVDFQRVAADGDLVFLHLREASSGQAMAIVDIFRVENGKIAEHWDVIQAVPQTSANPHPMF